MVKHIVMLKLKETEEPAEKLANALRLKKSLEDLKIYIDEIKFIEIGLNFNMRSSAYDLVLNTIFDSEEDLNKYRSHPKHVEVLDFLGEVTESTAVVDYKI
jgi:hypothetical protein